RDTRRHRARHRRQSRPDRRRNTRRGRRLRVPSRTPQTREVKIEIPQATLDDLARRLEHARWPDTYVLDGGERADRLDRIKALLDRWRGGSDRGAHAAETHSPEHALIR